MNDLVRASTLSAGPCTPAAGPSGVPGAVANPPPQAAQLPVGTALGGIVTGHDSGGRLLVRTEFGTLSVATRAQLPVNSEVTLQIRFSGTPLHVLLVQSEVQPGRSQGLTAPTVQQPHPSHAGGGEPQARPGGAPPDVLTLGQTVRAVVQASAAAQGAGPGPAPNPAAAGAASGIVPATSGGTESIAGPGGPGLSAVAARLTPGSELQLRIVTVQAPAQGLTAPAAPPGTAGPLAVSTAVQGRKGPGVMAPAASLPAASPPTAPPPTAPPPIAPPPGQDGSPGTVLRGQTAYPAMRRPGPAQPGHPFTQVSAGGAAGAAGRPGALAGAPAAAGPTTPGGSAPTALTAPDAGLARPRAAALQGASPGAPPGSVPASAAPASLDAARSITLSGAGAAAAGPAMTAANLAASPGGTPEAGALRFSGTVTAVTHAGQPVLQTPLGTLTLEIQARLPTGSRVTFALSAAAFGHSTPADGSLAPAPLGTLARSWPALEEALQALREVAAPDAGSRAATAMVPQPGPKLASGLLFFLAALSAGDVGRWLGHQATQALKTAGRETLLSRLGQDFGQLSRLAENPGGDWRLFIIPLLDADQVQQLRLFLRHGQQEHNGNGGEEDDESTRFIVEVELSRLGGLQLDGLVRDRRFDLILRTRAPLPDVMRHDIARIFQDANDAAGYRGNIGFQSSAEWGFMPIGAPEAASSGVVV